MKTYKTGTEAIIAKFAENSNKASFTSVGYFYGEYKVKLLDHAAISINHQSDIVYYNKNGFAFPLGAYWDKPSKKDKLFIRFDNDFVGDISENIFIDILTGEAFYHSYDHKTHENEQWNLGKLTKEEIKPLVNLYNKHYLENYAKNFKDNKWLECRKNDGYNDGYKFLGIHDEFHQVVFGERLEEGQVAYRNEKDIDKAHININ